MATEQTNVTGAVATLHVNDTPPVAAVDLSTPSVEALEALAQAAAVEATTVENGAPAPDPTLNEHLEKFLQDSPVSRAEFEELVDAFLRLKVRIDKFNAGSPHKI